MSKYAPLRNYLQAQITSEVPMTFAEIESVLGAPLPASAYRHRPWWANEAAGHVHATAWLEAGFEASQVDMPGQRLVFRRLPPQPAGIARSKRGGPGVSEDSWDSGWGEGGHARHPALGVLRGSFTMEVTETPAQSGFDLNLLAKARLIAEGLAAAHEAGA